jgi:hypothetical protein
MRGKAGIVKTGVGADFAGYLKPIVSVVKQTISKRAIY